MIDYEDIPYDFEEMIEDGEFVHGNFSKKFEEAMFDNELMEYGSYRRSHRIITDKCKELGYWGSVELLTGKTEDEIIRKLDEELKNERIKEMFEIAKEYSYVIIDKDFTKYL